MLSYYHKHKTYIFYIAHPLSGSSQTQRFENWIVPPPSKKVFALLGSLEGTS